MLEKRRGREERALLSFPEMPLRVGIRRQEGLAGCSYLLRYVPQRRLSSITAQTLLLFQQMPVWWVTVGMCWQLAGKSRALAN